MFKKLLTKIREITPKQLIVAGVFTLALAGSVGLGLANRQSASAAQQIRDCDNGNSIINVSPCGALDPKEFIADVRANNSVQKDLKAIYADPQVGGLEGDADYNRFLADAKPGVIKRNGDIVVDGQIVMKNAWTLGRHDNGKPGREQIPIAGKTFYTSVPEVSFAQGVQELDVWVLFDNEGSVEFAFMEACGNPIPRGEKVRSSATCDKLNSQKVEGKDNTYTFTTNISLKGYAKVTKVEYFVDGQLWQTMPNGTTKTPELLINKDVEVSVKVHISLPGGKTKELQIVEACKTKLKFDKIFYVCKELIATARDNTNRKFRFTVYVTKHQNVALKDVDFTLDGKVTTTGVTDKDGQGNIYKDYDFTDNVSHTITAKVKFTYNGQTVTAPQDCSSKVTPEKAPECPEKPGSGFPPGDPRCKDVPKECKPDVPIGSKECEPLPKTGPGSVAGLFAGASIAGTAAHRLFLRFRGSRDEL